MASEYRCILFPWKDIREALMVYQRRRGVAIPVKAPDKVTVDPKTISVELSYETGARPQRFRFDRESVAAAIILQCKDRGIRLPLKAKKDVYLIDTRLALVVHIAGPETEEFLAFELSKRVA
jgi:hypothetical protein